MTIRRMPAEKYVAVVERIVDLRRQGLTYREIDEVLGGGVKSRRWMTGRKTRRFARMIGL